MKTKTFISLLRGINVSGQKKILMNDLRELFESLGLTNVRTYVQSGNVVFDCTEKSISALAEKIESHLAKKFGFTVKVFIRSADGLRNVIAGNPFVKQGKADESRLYITFLSGNHPGNDLIKIDSDNKTGDQFIISGSEIFLHCPGGYGRTKLNNNFFENKLKMPATTRNWNTVNALYKMANQK